MVLENSDTEDEHNSVDTGIPRTPFNTPVEGTNSSKTVLSTKQLEVNSCLLFGFCEIIQNLCQAKKWENEKLTKS